MRHGGTGGVRSGCLVGHDTGAGVPSRVIQFWGCRVGRPLAGRGQSTYRSQVSDLIDPAI